jgi:succinate-semialdehyde dehydrogenase/glutarate-semialdehyde dehydrogenase
MRQRLDEIATIMTTEQGKPLFEAKVETNLAADIIDWMAEEGRRTYGRIVPARAENVYQLVMKEPVGPVAGLHAVELPDQPGGAQGLGRARHRLLDHHQGTGGHAGLVRAAHQGFVDAGVPAGVIQLVYGVPSEISEYLIPHPIIKKVTFTGSTPGRQAARRSRRRAHEARHHGAGRPRAGRSCSRMPTSSRR